MPKSPHVYALALGLMSDVATSPLRLDMKQPGTVKSGTSVCISLQLESTDVLIATSNSLFIDHSTQCMGRLVGVRQKMLLLNY